MEKRRSINVPGASHANPIPSASRRGPFVVTGAIAGTDPATGKVPEDLDQQCRQMFDNVRRVITAAGGTPDDIVKMTVWITDRALRPVLNNTGSRCSPIRSRARPATPSPAAISPRRCRSNATSSRWSRIDAGAVRPSRRPLRGLLRMTYFLNAIINLRHPEEARSAVSKDARWFCSP